MNYKIKNWQRYQHYRHRCPPWIKLHYELLTSADWVSLDDAGRVLAIACMLLASRNNGKVSGNPGYVKRVCYLNSEPDFRPLLACGFLEPDGAEPKPEPMPTQEPELQESEPQEPKAQVIPAGFAAFWQVYPRKVGKQAVLRAWLRVKRSPSWPGDDVVMQALAKQKKSEQWLKDGGQFIPMPLTWLNQGRWDDVDITPSSNSGVAHPMPSAPMYRKDKAKDEKIEAPTKDELDRIVGELKI